MGKKKKVITRLNMSPSAELNRSISVPAEKFSKSLSRIALATSPEEDREMGHHG